MKHLGLIAFLAFLSAQGCSAAVDDPAAELELGTGTWRFDALWDGQSVALVRGAQGGWHVWVSLRAQGVEADEGLMTLTMQPEDESSPPAVTEVKVRFDPPDEKGRRLFLGWPAVVRDASCRRDEMLRIETHLRIDERNLTAERYVIPTGGAYPPPPCDAL